MPLRPTAVLMLLLPLASAASVAWAADTPAPASPSPPPAPVPPPLPVHTAAECEVWARELSFARSVADHDAAAFASHVAENAAFGANGPEPTRGRAAIARQWQSLVEGDSLRLSWYPTRVTIAGVPDVALSSGPALFEDTQPVPHPHYRIGRFESVWHRDADGVWRVLFDGGVPPHVATDSEVAAFRAGRLATCPQG